MTKNKPKVAELFAGVGGFRLGLDRAGFETIFSNQWEPSTRQQHASSVYTRNFGTTGHSNQDISNVLNFPTDPEVIVGGFPCQDYSVAKTLNSANGIEGKKGVLWWEILRLTAEHKPKFVFLENVDRLLKSPSSQRGRDFAIMLKTIGDLGYEVEWRVTNAAAYGHAQRRIRVFIVARRLDLSCEPNLQMLLGTSGTLARALPMTFLTETRAFGLSGDAIQLTEDFNRGGKTSPFLAAGVYRDGEVLTSSGKSSYDGKNKTMGDVLIPEDQVAEKFWIDTNQLKEWEYLKGSKKIEREHKGSGFKYFYSEGKMAFPDSLEKPSRTILTAEGGTAPSRFKHVISVNGRFRRLVPLELERLNEFPDNWTALGINGEIMTDTKRAFFMGNALVVGLIETIGKEILKELILPKGP